MLPGSLASIVTALRMSGICPRALINSDGGMATDCFLPDSSRYENSLFRLSLPLTNGVPKAIATSRQARAARTRLPSVSGRSVLPQQKLSRIAIRAGSAPTATQFRTASSMADAAIQ